MYGVLRPAMARVCGPQSSVIKSAQLPRTRARFCSLSFLLLPKSCSELACRALHRATRVIVSKCGLKLCRSIGARRLCTSTHIARPRLRAPGANTSLSYARPLCDSWTRLTALKSNVKRSAWPFAADERVGRSANDTVTLAELRVLLAASVQSPARPLCTTLDSSTLRVFITQPVDPLCAQQYPIDFLTA